MKNQDLNSILSGIIFLCFMQISYSQIFEYDCYSVPSTAGIQYNVDEQNPFGTVLLVSRLICSGLVFTPPIDGKLNRISFSKSSTDLNGTALLFEGVVLSSGSPNPVATEEFYNTYDTDLLSISFDSVDVSAGVYYTVFVTVNNISFVVFTEGVYSNISGSVVYQGTAQPYAVAYELCIRYTVPINQSDNGSGTLSKSEVATIVAAICVPLVSLLIAGLGILCRHGLTSKDDEETAKSSKGSKHHNEPREKKEIYPKFPKTSKAELQRIQSEDEAPSSNEGSDNEALNKKREDDGESSNSE